MLTSPFLSPHTSEIATLVCLLRTDIVWIDVKIDPPVVKVISRKLENFPESFRRQQRQNIVWMISDFGEEQFGRRNESFFVDPSFFVFTLQRFVAFSVQNDTTNSFNEQESIPDKKCPARSPRCEICGVCPQKALCLLLLLGSDIPTFLKLETLDTRLCRQSARLTTSTRHN